MVRTVAVRAALWPRRLSILLLMALATIVSGEIVDSAQAQSTRLLAFPPRPKPIVPHVRPPTQKPPMLLQANEINYDYVNKRVSAVGGVQIYYSNSTLEADRVIYDETTKRLHAEGNVRLTDASGQVTYGDLMNLSDDFRDGFIDSLRIETADQTRIAAARGDRTSGGDFTVFQSGVYTACEPCRDDPKKPPLWQIKAARIIHDTGEKMIYFEDAKLEFFGQPMAYFPYFSTPDPTVKRKSGFLLPNALYDSMFGFGIQVPYYWAIAPNYDITLTPRIMSNQGVLLRSEWRHRLDSGYYSVLLSGIYQLDKEYFLDEYKTKNYPSYRDFRGSIETRGKFAITDRWHWGWDGLLPTDSLFYSDYKLASYQRSDSTLLRTGLTEGVSQLYVAGMGNRSYFDVRSIYYYGFSVADVQSQIPVIHPVMDYFYTFDNPILGGEAGFRVNVTSLSRDNGSFDPISQQAMATGLCAPTTADPATTKNPANCLLRGIPGNYSRFSAEGNWRRTYTDPIGQQWTPFASVRGDAAFMSIGAQAGVSNYIAPGDRSEFRAMPTAGVEYRYPFISIHSWGTQTVTPIAQIIVRPNETGIGQFPNEDAQSLIFDDSNLFKINKFGGWDRVEGGGRANVGLQYTAQFNRAGFLSAMFGQSYQMFGTNSFAVADTTNTGLGSGLDKSSSDYVARLSYQPDRTYTFTTRYRFDQATFDLNRFEVEGRATYDRISLSLLYGQYAPQPELGFLNWRQGILSNVQYKLGANWVASASANYDVDAGKFVSTLFGIGYIDDCFIIAANYATSYSYSTLPSVAPVLNHVVMLTIALRTIGSTGTSQSLTGVTGLISPPDSSNSP